MTDVVDALETPRPPEELSFRGLNYTRVWEDHRTLTRGLRVQADDDVLSICSAGDNVLALALEGPRSVTAVDVNPDQLALLNLHIAGIRTLDHEGYLELLGVVCGDAPSHYERARRALDEESRRYWDAHRVEIEAGIVGSGRLDRFFERFRTDYLSRCVDVCDLRRLFEFDDLDEQRTWFTTRIASVDLEHAVHQYFRRSHVAREGRSEEQQAFVDIDDIGREMWERFHRMCTTRLVRNNYYLRLMLLGSPRDPAVAPPHLRPDNFDRLGVAVERITAVASRIGALVHARPHGTYSAANLSDMFEYLSPAATTDLLRVLADRMRPGARLGWWCLMVPRPVPAELVGVGLLWDDRSRAAALEAEDRTWFYESYQLAIVASSLPRCERPPTQRDTAHHASTRDEPATEATTHGSASPAPVSLGPGGARSAPSVPARGQYSEAARETRMAWLRTYTGMPLSALGDCHLKADSLRGNVENLVGSVEVPVGLAGPLLFRGEHAEGLLYAPLATSEGALVASASRGATALTRAGGVATRMTGQRMLRAPLFRFGDLHSAGRFVRWLQQHVDDLRIQVSQASRWAELTALEPVVLGRDVHVRFVYRTGDAAGQNMTTACTWQACRWVLEQLRHQPELAVEQFFLEAYMSGDKKLLSASFLDGRGFGADAEALLTRSVVQEVLKATPEDLMSLYLRGVSGGLKAGLIGGNVNAANTVAALFAATGQDMGCVHESAVGTLALDLVDGDLYASLSMPCLVIGTVGGGTGLPAQRECLELLGCHGEGTAARLAEIIAGFALALDLSTLAAVANGSFAAAHDALGRNRPEPSFRRRDLTPGFFEAGLRRHLADPELTVTEARPLRQLAGSAVLTELTATASRGLVGLLPFGLSYRTGDGTPSDYDVVVKAKASAEEARMAGERIASLCGARVGEAFRAHQHLLPFTNAGQREVAMANLDHPAFRAHMPATVRTLVGSERDSTVIVQELLGDDVELLDSVTTPDRWDPAAIRTALDGIAECHAVHLGGKAGLVQVPWLAPVIDSRAMCELLPLWEALLDHASAELPHLVSRDDIEGLRQVIDAIPAWWPELEAMPTTLVHNDFNPRNIALRRRSDGTRSLVAYDWELATLHVPQRDLAELLAFVLPEDVSCATVDAYIGHHRVALERAARTAFDPQAWRRGYALALCDFGVSRLLLLAMVHTLRELEFFEALWRRFHHLLTLETGAGLTLRKAVHV